MNFLNNASAESYLLTQAKDLASNLTNTELYELLDHSMLYESAEDEILNVRERISKLMNSSTETLRVLKQKLLESFNDRANRTTPENNSENNFPSNFKIPPNSILALKPLPLFSLKKTLIPPFWCTLIPRHAFVSLSRTFDLPNNIGRYISRSEGECKYQIFLRFQPHYNTPTIDHLPKNLIVTVNDIQCNLPTINLKRCQPWRYNIPINITAETDLRKRVQNKLVISWRADKVPYMIGVYVVKKLTHNQIRKQFKKERSCDVTKNMIKQIMETDDNCHVGSINVSIKDPVSQLRMKVPARGVNCIHLQCFDAIQFLRMNEKRPAWDCPICKKNVQLDDIEIDNFFLSLVKSQNLSKTCESVILHKDGSWTEKPTKKYLNVLETDCPPPTKKIMVITLDSDEADNQ